MKNQYLYTLVAGFVGGIFLSSFFKIGFSFFLFSIILSVIIFIYGRFFAQSKNSIILISLFILAFGLGILRYEVKNIQTGESLKSFINQEVLVEGIVSEEPSQKENNLRLIVNLRKINDKEVESHEKILVSTGLFPEFKYGDLIRVSGKLEKPENFLTESGRDFDYINYLAKDDIFYQISFAEVNLLANNKGSFIKTKLFSFKNSFIEKNNLAIKEPESSLLSGLLLGAKNSLGKDLQTDFQKAGVSHIVALSGYNITIVAESIIIALSFLAKSTAISFGVLGIIMFAIMTGASATVVRASIMALLVILAKSTGRKYDITRALILAGLFMVIQNPKILVFDLSFQLSFLATLALIFVSPIVEQKMTFITEKYKIRELVVSTLATQIFVLPFLLYKIGLLSFFALFSNVLILPVIPLIMLLGFIVGILGFVSITIIIPVAFICSLLLSYILGIIKIVANLPFSFISLDYFPLSLMIFIYLIYLVIIIRFQNNSPRLTNLN